MNNKVLIIGLAAVAVIGVAVLTMSGPKKQAEQTQVVNISPTTAVTSAPAATGEAITETGPYKAGKYTAEGSYVSPGGPEQVKVTLALKADGTISDVEFVGEAVNPTSKKMQGLFAGGYKPLVMGKNIDEVKLDKVSGSSLTPMGFNDAIEKIKAEAAQG